jgi:HK97 family phage major capsid protein
MAKYKGEDIDLKPTEGMRSEARRGLDWRKEHGRGGTAVGVARARDIVNGRELSASTVRRMYSFFSRHEVDKQGKGFDKGEEGYPSAGRIAWALWGGDAGFSWSRKLVKRLDAIDERSDEMEMETRAEPDELKVGDMVSWNSSGGRAEGKISRIVRDGSIDVPDSDFTIEGTEDNPAALITLYRDGEPTDRKVGHRFSALTKISERYYNEEERHIKAVTETDDSFIIEYGKSEEPEMAVEEEEERSMVDPDYSKRAMGMDASPINADERRVSMALSSEEPVERSFGTEVLEHSEEAVDLEFARSGRMPLLMDHDPTKQIGVVESVDLDGSARRLRATVRFGKNGLAREAFDDVVDGIRANISIGYAINKMERQGTDKYVAKSWRVLEASLVSIPADVSVGVGRSSDASSEPVTVTVKEETPMTNEVDVAAIELEARKAAQKDAAQIVELGARHNQSEMAKRAIAEGRSVAEFRGELLDVIGSERALESQDIGMTEKELKKFSLVRAIHALANPTDRRAQEAAAFEFECSEAAAAEFGRAAQGIMLPTDVMRTWKRDLNSADEADLFGEDYRGADFIDVLRNASSVMQAGARTLNGLSGDVRIPKKTAAASAAWIASEGGAATESEMTVGNIAMTPKTLGAFTDVTRQLMIQSSMDVEALIRDDLATAIALAIDLAGLEGSGSSGQPTGILNTSGINSVTNFAAANPTFAEVVTLETALAEDNALMGNLAYILPAAMYGALKTTEKASGTAQFVVEPGGTINGYRAIVSNQGTAGNLYFGNFSDLLVGFFGGLDLVVDPYTASTTGTVRVVALQSMDVAVRHAVSFAKGNDGA